MIFWKNNFVKKYHNFLYFQYLDFDFFVGKGIMLNYSWKQPKTHRERCIWSHKVTRKRDFQPILACSLCWPGSGSRTILSSEEKNTIACLQMDLARSSDGVERSTAALNLLQYHLGQQSRTFRSVWEWFNPANSTSSFLPSISRV